MMLLTPQAWTPSPLVGEGKDEGANRIGTLTSLSSPVTGEDGQDDSVTLSDGCLAGRIALSSSQLPPAFPEYMTSVSGERGR